MDNNVENNINSEFNGLTAAEVNARIEAGKINIADDSSDRTTGKIIRDNLLTYFNLIIHSFPTRRSSESEERRVGTECKPSGAVFSI